MALQGKVAPMVFQQHAGLYLLLVVGIVLCFILIFVEHATFKWMVPFWRSKPGNSFWKSLSMMFWSQVRPAEYLYVYERILIAYVSLKRLYRIITSEELISPHHTAKEMLEVVRNRDFTKLFQKSVKKVSKFHTFLHATRSYCERAAESSPGNSNELQRLLKASMNRAAP